MERKTLLLTNICAGVGVGALLGLVMGLSTSPVTSTILGSISAALLVLLGLSGTTQSGETAYQRSVTVAAFGLSCTIMLAIGVYFRTHSVLALSLTEQDRQLQSVFSDPSERRRILLFQNYGLLAQNGNQIMPGATPSFAEQDSKSPPAAKGRGVEERPSSDQSVRSTGSSPAAGFLRNGIADRCSYSQRKKFASLQAYLLFLRRVDPQLAGLIEAQPSQSQDPFSFAISDYLCR